MTQWRVEASSQPFSVKKVWLASEATVGHGVRTFDIRDRETDRGRAEYSAISATSGQKLKCMEKAKPRRNRADQILQVVFKLKNVH